ncbi:hypothetical protein RUND412_005259 [Rhizina undulata]
MYTRCGNYKSIVDTDSAILHLPQDLEDKIPINSDHTNIVKFDGKMDEAYEYVILRMQKYLKAAPADVKERIDLLHASAGGHMLYKFQWMAQMLEIVEDAIMEADA